MGLGAAVADLGRSLVLGWLAAHYSRALLRWWWAALLSGCFTHKRATGSDGRRRGSGRARGLVKVGARVGDWRYGAHRDWLVKEEGQREDQDQDQGTLASAGEGPAWGGGRERLESEWEGRRDSRQSEWATRAAMDERMDECSARASACGAMMDGRGDDCCVCTPICVCARVRLCQSVVVLLLSSLHGAVAARWWWRPGRSRLLWRVRNKALY